MAKSAGGVRNVAAGSTAYNNRLKEVAEMRASGKYSSVEMAPNGTGWIAIEKSSRTHSAEEIEAATHLANAGYKVTLTDEAGHAETADGKVFNYSYEQSTPTTKTGEQGAKECIGHAASKIRSHWAKHHKEVGYKPMKIDVALIYDKHNRFTRSDIENGLKAFERSEKRIRYQKVIVVSSRCRIHVHKHNDK